MKRLMGGVILIFWLNSFLLFVSTQLQSDKTTAWERFTGDCTTQDFCWYQLSAVHSSADDVVAVVYKFLPPDVVVEQSVQWRHPEGYEGYVRFAENAVVSMEIRFPTDLNRQHQVMVGDVILALGIPDEVEIGSFGQVLLHYSDLFLVVQARTGLAYHLRIYHPVARLQLFSPYSAVFNQGVSTSQTKVNRQWQGFSNYLPQER